MAYSDASVSFGELGDPRFVQEKLGYGILTDYKFAIQMVDIMDVNYFNLSYVRVVVGEYLDYFRKYRLFPSFDMLKDLVKNNVSVVGDETLGNQTFGFVDALKTYVAELDTDMPFVKEQAFDFCKKQRVYRAMFEASEKLDKIVPRSGSVVNSEIFNDINAVLNSALMSGGEKDIGLIYCDDIESRIRELVNREPVSTGYTSLDNLIRGGFGKGELTVVIAPTGGGKSTFLINFGVNALLMGKKVVHYSFEMNTSIVALRYDSNIMGMPLEEFVEVEELPGGKKRMNIKDSIRGKLATLKADYLQPNSGLIVKQYPSRQATVASIRSHLTSLNARGFIPDLIICDYGDIMKPTVKRSEKRYELEEIYSELRALAMQFQCPVITASQTNREGWSSEMVTLKHIAESYSKSNEVDLALCLSRTSKDKVRGVARLLIAKNRNGKEGLVFPCRYFDSIYKIDLLNACSMEDLPVEFAASEQEALQGVLRKYGSSK